ncbi:hypothetical protein [Rubrivirga sp. IMCC43871]|uniref:hypothetical protein n=1 Tax=Rubrivirga sp. IMCC43871 TaxID=3391575 RepID=UPI003990081C
MHRLQAKVLAFQAEEAEAARADRAEFTVVVDVRGFMSITNTGNVPAAALTIENGGGPGETPFYDLHKTFPRDMAPGDSADAWIDFDGVATKPYPYALEWTAPDLTRHRVDGLLYDDGGGRTVLRPSSNGGP